MEPFEYVIVLFSLILGLGIAQLLTGTADIISNLKNVKPYWPHTLFVFNTFLLHIQEWWYSYSYMEEVKGWTLPLVMFLMVYPVQLFLLARMLFPTGLRGSETDIKAYYEDQWPWFYAIFAAIALVSFLQNVLVSEYSISSQLMQIILFVFYLAFLIFRIKDKLLHIVFLGTQAIGWIAYMVLDNTVLS